MRKRSGKLLAFLLALTMTAGMMAGCGSDKAEGSADTEQDAGNTDKRREKDLRLW